MGGAGVGRHLDKLGFKSQPLTYWLSNFDQGKVSMLYFFIGEIKTMTVRASNVIKIKGDDEGKVVNTVPGT